MKIAALHRTSIYRGDHHADVAVAYQVKPGETVEELVARVFYDIHPGDVVAQTVPESEERRRAASEWLELRIIQGEFGA